MENITRMDAFRRKAEALAEGDLTISEEMFNAFSDRVDSTLTAGKDAYSHREILELLLNCFTDLMWSVAKVEALARGKELTLSRIEDSETHP